MISGGAVHRRRGHHGLAAAHIPLDQAVHGGPGRKVPEDVLHRPALGPGEGEGQGGIEGLHIQIEIGLGPLLRPGRPHQREARREYEKLLKDQPFLGLFRLLHGARLVDDPVGLLRREDFIFLPDLPGQNLRRRIAHRKRLPDQLQQHLVGQPRRQRIDGQHLPGGHPGGLHRLKDGVCHIVADKIPGDRAVENILPAVLQQVRDIAVVEEGQAEPAGGVRHLDLGNVQSLADVGETGGVHDHGPEAGGHVRLQLFNGDQLRPVLVAPGEVADQIPQRAYAEIFQLLGPGGADAL